MINVYECVFRANGSSSDQTEIVVAVSLEDATSRILAGWPGCHLRKIEETQYGVSVSIAARKESGE